MGLKRIGIGLALLFAAPHAWAGNDVANVSAFYHSSLASVAVRSIVNGDDDTSHVCRIFAGLERASDSGMVMVRRTGTNICEGRILWMGPNDVVRVQVEVNDGGAKRRTPETIVQVATVPGLPTTGTRIYVSQTTGNNASNGLTPGTAKRTLNQTAEGPGAREALMALADSGARGGIVCLGRNVFHERIDLTFGRDGLPRFITGDPSDRSATVICGANEHGEAGRRDVSNALTWTADATSPIYRAYLPDDAVQTSFGDSISSVIIGEREYLHRKTSVKALCEDSTGSAASANQAAGGERSGWYWQNDTLYIKRASGAAPPSSGINFGYRTWLIAIAGRNWMVKNLTVRYAGGPLLCDNGVGVTVNCNGGVGAQSSAQDPPTNGHGIINVRSANVNASGLVVDSCHVYGCTGLGVYGAYSTDAIRADSVTVANSIFDGLTIGSMQYREAKDRLEEDSNVLKVTGSHSNVFKNIVTETHNGIQAGPNAPPPDTTWGNYDEIAGNAVYQLSDDAIELDTAIGMNMAVFGNVTDKTNTGVSIAPIYTGPAFFIGNTCTRFKFAGVKTGFLDRATVLIYQNTFVTEEPATAAYGFNQIQGRHVLRNNILSAAKGINIFTLGPGSFSIDYSAIDSTVGNRLIRYSGADGLSWASWLATGNDANSVYGDVGFVGLYPPAGRRADARILPSSPARGAGLRIPGVNTDFRGNRYTGSSPDIGAQVCLTCARRTHHDR